jgi:hypothetical protein
LLNVVIIYSTSVLVFFNIRVLVQRK